MNGKVIQFFGIFGVFGLELEFLYRHLARLSILKTAFFGFCPIKN